VPGARLSYSEHLTPADRLRREFGRQDVALAVGQPAQLAVLVQRERGEELPDAGATPPTLASQELADAHRLDLPGTVPDYLGDVDLVGENGALQ
jgi:hypothetical protein